jgi:hypothetical protein
VRRIPRAFEAPALEQRVRQRRELLDEDLGAPAVFFREHVLQAAALQVQHAEGRVFADGRAQHGVDVRALNAGAVAKARIEEGRRSHDHLSGAERLRNDAARDQRPDLADLFVRAAGGRPPGLLVGRVLGFEDFQVPLLGLYDAYDQAQGFFQKVRQLRTRIQPQQTLVEVSFAFDAWEGFVAHMRHPS